MQLDLKSSQLLGELEMNARLTHSQLGKKLRLSKQVVKYRIEALEKENIIQGYNAIVDLEKLGKTIYVIYLKLIKMSSLQERDWISQLSKDKNLLAVGKNAGYWDLTLVIRAQNNSELDNFLKKVLQGKQEKIKEKLITSEINSTYLSTNICSSNKKEFSTSKIAKELRLDEKDEILLNLLSHNCRFTLVQLSEKLNLTANAVKNRIKNLEKNKIVMGYKTKINYEKLGFLHFRVFLHLNKFDEDLFKQTKEFLHSNGNVESISHYSGYADIDFRCYAKSLVEFYSLISKLKDKFLNNIIEIDSMAIFNWEKINFY